MSRIAINDLNPADSSLIELSDEELLMINGESLFGKILGIAAVVAGAATGNVALVAAGVFAYEHL
jgi:hypothetical protein